VPCARLVKVGPGVKVPVEVISENVYGAIPPDGEAPMDPVEAPAQPTLRVVTPGLIVAGCVMVTTVEVTQPEASFTAAVYDPVHSEVATEDVVAPGVQE
jgi:hypothetical protein